MSLAPSSTPQSAPPAWEAMLEYVAARARDSGVFGEVVKRGSMLEAAAKVSAAPACYRLFIDGGRVWVSLATADRYLSQSIEQDLVHTGDKLPELLEEELVDLGFPGLGHSSSLLAVEHFRDAEKLFTFRTALPIELNRLTEKSAQDTAAVGLLAYEACFRRLGDMESGE